MLVPQMDVEVIDGITVGLTDENLISLVIQKGILKRCDILWGRRYF